MQKKATRTYRDLKGRTTTKSRLRRYDRIPGDQFDVDKALNEDYLNIDDSDPFDVAEEVDPADVEVVTDLLPPKPDVNSVPEEMSDTVAPEEHYEEEKVEMDYEDGMEVKDEDIEEAYYGDDTPEEMADEPFEDEDKDGEAEACMYKKSEASFAERLRIAMDPEEALMDDLGEEIAVDDMAEDMAVEGPCPAGCEPVVSEEPAEGEEGILEVGEDDVTFLDEEPKEAATEESEVVEAAPEEEVVAAPIEEMASDESDNPEQPIYETLGDITALGEVGTDQVEMVLTQEESDNPQYVVLVDGDPVAKVAFEDQQNMTADHADMFTDEEYPQYVLEGIDNFGLEETLKHVHARYYTAQAKRGEVAQQMRTAAVQELQVVQTERLAELKDNLVNTANIVLEGSLKNYVTENPLRDELVRLIRSAGMHENDALDIVEEAFRVKGSDFFRAVIAKAEEWLGAPKEVLEHHIKEISAMNYRHPGYVRQETEEIPEERVATTVDVPRNVPIRTVAAAPQQEGAYNREALKKELNLHGLLVQKSLANRG